MDRWTNDSPPEKAAAPEYGLKLGLIGAGLIGLFLLVFMISWPSDDGPSGDVSLSPALEAALEQVVTFRSPALQPEGRAALLVQKRSAVMALRDLLGPLPAQEAALFALLNGRLDSAQRSVHVASGHDAHIAATLARVRMDYGLAAQVLRQALQEAPENPLQLTLTLADSLSEQGRVTADPAPLREAVILYKHWVIPQLEGNDALALVTNNLGIALQGLAAQTADHMMLEEAAIAFSDSLRYQPDGAHVAGTKASFAAVLYDLAVIASNDTLLDAAQSALREAIGHGPTPALGLYEHQLVSVLLLQAQNLDAAPLFDEIDALLKRVLGASPTIVSAQQAAQLQTRFGNALAQHGEAARDMGLLIRAAQAYDAALSLVHQNSQPLVWAALQANLGTVNAAMAGQELPGHGYAQASAAFRAALGVYAMNGAGLHWAMIQNNLALTLEGEAARIGDASLLNEAMRRYAAALEVLESEDTALAAQVRENLSMAELRSLDEQLQMSNAN